MTTVIGYVLGIIYAVAIVWFVLWIGQKKLNKDAVKHQASDPINKESNYWW